MAIIQNPLISRASGSVGNSIFSKWKNKNTLRSKSINPYPPASPAQLTNQQKMRDLLNLYYLLRPYSTLFFSSRNTKYSYLAYLVKQNMKVFTGDANIVTSNLVPTMSFSFSYLPITPKCSLVLSIDNHVEFHLNYSESPPNLGSLVGCYVIYFNRNTRQFGLVFSSSPGYVFAVTIPDASPTDSVDVFACCLFESPTACSPFRFVTTTN